MHFYKIELQNYIFFKKRPIHIEYKIFMNKRGFTYNIKKKKNSKN